MVWTGWAAANRRDAIMASQQQPQQLQMKFTPSRTFSPNCTRSRSWARWSSSIASPTPTSRAWPCRMSDEAEALKVMQMSWGASQAFPTCSILWRQ